jgi:hypothetical protein
MNEIKDKRKLLAVLKDQRWVYKILMIEEKRKRNRRRKRVRNRRRRRKKKKKKRKRR